MLEYEKVKISDLKLNPNNPRINDDASEKLIKGIKEYGFVNPVIVNKRDSMVLAGHTRIKALQKMGETSIPVIYVDMNEVDARGFSIWDNKSAEFSKWDQDLLKLEIEGLSNDGFDIELTGFDFDFLEISVPGQQTKTLDDEYIDENCEMPIVPDFFENHQCFLIVTHSQIDEQFVRQTFGLNEKHKSNSGDKKERKTNVIDVDSLRRIWLSK